MSQVTISDKNGVFSKTGPIRKELLDRHDQVARALRTHFSWDGEDNTAALVTSVEENTGRLLDIGWVTLGSRTIKFKASCPQEHLIMDSAKKKSTLFYMAVEERTKEAGIEISVRQSFLTDPAVAVKNLKVPHTHCLIALAYATRALKH